jgi:hypothetical protein
VHREQQGSEASECERWTTRKKHLRTIALPVGVVVREGFVEVGAVLCFTATATLIVLEFPVWIVRSDGG